MHAQSFNRVQLFATPWTAACWTSLSVEFFRQENTGVGCHFLHWRILLTQVLNPCLLHLLHWNEVLNEQMELKNDVLGKCLEQQNQFHQWQQCTLLENFDSLFSDNMWIPLSSSFGQYYVADIARYDFLEISFKMKVYLFIYFCTPSAFLFFLPVVQTL